MRSETNCYVMGAFAVIRAHTIGGAALWKILWVNPSLDGTPNRISREMFPEDLGAVQDWEKMMRAALRELPVNIGWIYPAQAQTPGTYLLNKQPNGWSLCLTILHPVWVTQEEYGWFEKGPPGTRLLDKLLATIARERDGLDRIVPRVVSWERSELQEMESLERSRCI